MKRAIANMNRPFANFVFTAVVLAVAGCATSPQSDSQDSVLNSNTRVGTVPDLGNQEVTIVYGSKVTK